MLDFNYNLSRAKRVLLLLIGGPPIILTGGILGSLLGLMVTTFIPICCEGGSCHNCFEFRGMVGYEATGFIGFWFGILLSSVGCVISIIYLIKKQRSK